jgi:hypothetical protein
VRGLICRADFEVVPSCLPRKLSARYVVFCTNAEFASYKVVRAQHRSNLEGKEHTHSSVPAEIKN